MNILGIDVSSYQGNIIWSKVAGAGIKFAVLKIIRKDLQKDSKFEVNWDGCKKAGIDIAGVYNYSYATSTAKAIRDAHAVVDALEGRTTTVWLDVEDDCMKGLGKNLISIIDAYAKVISNAGLGFGVYTGASFYNTYIKKYGGISYPLWIAAYGTNNGQPQTNKMPTMTNCIGWQFTSKGSVPGIVGNVDINYFYAGATIINPYSEPILTQKLGSRGTGVKWIQWQLCYKGFELKIDGIYGPKTEEKVVAFQKSVFPHDRKEWDGKVGKKTKAALKV